MSNTSITVNSLDFDENVANFTAFIKQHPRWKDIDFTAGDNVSLFIDLLAYNTMLHGFYYNMVSNESHLDSAQLRESAVSRAKELNYTPRSFKSATATVDINITSDDLTRTNVVIAKGTPFNARIDNKNYVFTTDQMYVATTSNASGNTQTFTAEDVKISEGIFQNESFVYSENKKSFTLSNPRTDTSSINITVIEDDGANVESYSRAQSLFDVDETSNVFFVQGTINDLYEVMFGDGVFGKAPKNNSIVNVEYRVSSGELANGARAFVPIGTIDGEANINVVTKIAAGEGNVHESLESIKFNAPRHFATQERAVTADDYESLMKINFPEILDISAFGGETVDPPQYGKVYVSVVLNDIDSLPQGKKDEYYRFLKARSMVSIDPQFIDPQIIYIDVTSKVKYSVTRTNLSPNDVRSLVISKIDQYNDNNINGFNKEFRYSNFVSAIDQAHGSVVSNETQINLIKKFTYAGQPTVTLDYGVPLRVPTSDNDPTITSTTFIYNQQPTIISDDGKGVVNLVTTDRQSVVNAIGIIDYEKGVVNLTNLFSQNLNQPIKLYAIGRSLNIAAANHSIIRIDPADVKVEVVQTR